MGLGAEVDPPARGQVSEIFRASTVLPLVPETSMQLVHTSHLVGRVDRSYITYSVVTDARMHASAYDGMLADVTVSSPKEEQLDNDPRVNRPYPWKSNTQASIGTNIKFYSVRS